jgi:Spy/CpxP family protein refolding chaperone
MTNLKKILVGFMAGSLLLAMPLAQAQNDPGMQEGGSPKWREGQHFQGIFKQLNLTDEQKKELEANKKQNRERMQSTRQAMKTEKQALQGELMKPQLDMVKINAIHQQIKTLQSQMEDDKLNSILAVRAILTPEQFLKFTALIHKHKQEHP